MKLERNKSFILNEIAGEKILMARGTEAIDYGALVVFNDTGILIWESLEQPKTFDELSDILVKEYEISKEQADADLNAFLEKSFDEGFIVKTE